mmetsp:Transcript_34253/g.82482  ORF Transcript_34253/g.82482 Transcript_34253/m.82482 type:complete len:373 (+) Transcript_34253:96-1214(+)
MTDHPHLHNTHDTQLGVEVRRRQIQIDFDRDGFVRIPPSVFCLDETTVGNLREECDRLFNGSYETGIYPDEIHYRPGISRPDVTRELCNVWKSSLTMRNVVCGEALGRMACNIMGWSSCRLGQDDLIHKPPSSSPPPPLPPPPPAMTSTCKTSSSDAVVGFHQDGTYISDNFLPRDDNCLTVWIALDDADTTNGALQYAPGSHKWHWGDEPSRDVSASSFHVATTDAATEKTDDDDDNNNSESDRLGRDLTTNYPKHLHPLVEAVSCAGENPKDVLESVRTVDVPAGQVVVHHQRTWHGSGPNSSQNPPRPRRALVAHVLNGDVTWRTNPPPHYIYGRYYIRGETAPREDFFPVLYSSEPTARRRRTKWLDE